MSTMVVLSPSDKLRQQPINLDSLPFDYRQRVEHCDSVIALHELRRAIAMGAKKWSYCSLAFDTACIAVGGFFFHETWRLADEEVSFMRALTANPGIRRVFTPFPFFSTMLIVGGLLCIPSDIVALAAAKKQYLLEEFTITRLEDNKAGLVAEALQLKSTQDERSVSIK